MIRESCVIYSAIIFSNSFFYKVYSAWLQYCIYFVMSLVYWINKKFDYIQNVKIEDNESYERRDTFIVSGGKISIVATDKEGSFKIK